MIADVLVPRGSILQGTLTLMQNLVDAWSVHPFMVQLARAIVSKAGAKNPVDETKAIWSWTRRMIDYRRDPVGAEWVQDPLETVINAKAGDCDDLSVVCGSLLQALGHPCAMTSIQWVGRDTFSHAVCVDKLAGKVVDAVAPAFEPWPPAGYQVANSMEAK